jgi:ATP-dependent 26S proteasome regulatory subunit
MASRVQAIRLVTAVSSMLVSAVLGYLVTWKLQQMLDASASVDGTHRAAARSMVTTPQSDGGDAFARVGGYESVKTALQRAVVRPLKHPKLFFDGPPALHPPRGVILYGPPGTGKTMLVRCVAEACRVPMMCLHAATLENKWFGESAKLLQAAFEVARTELAPCIVFMDELDALGRERTESDQACVYSMKCELLRNLDAVSDSRKAVAVLACTNCVQRIDAALARRFPLQLQVGPPDERARRAILHTCLQSCTSHTSEATTSDLIERIVDTTEGFTGAALASHVAAAQARRLDASTAFADNATLEKFHTGESLLAAAEPLAWSHFHPQPDAGSTVPPPRHQTTSVK